MESEKEEEEQLVVESIRPNTRALHWWDFTGI